MKLDIKINNYFSDTYEEARKRFIMAANAIDAKVESYEIHSNSLDGLTVDVAIHGDRNDPALVVSSGVHGVEGFFGSAVQLALMHNLNNSISRGKIRYVLIHGINPFGFKYGRRVNEDNVDLNRNFMTKKNSYKGVSENYIQLNRLLNPASVPPRLELFKIKIILKILRMSFPKFKEAVVSGQYEYPKSLFFGGSCQSKSMMLVQENCDSWIASSQKIMHIDLHTGLGKYCSFKLLVTEPPESEKISWYSDMFGDDFVEPLEQPEGTAYKASGVFGKWMQDHYKTRDYRFIGAEFGTYNSIRVLSALRDENRAYHYCSKESKPYINAKKELRECFYPISPSWRRQVLESALKIIEQGVSALIVNVDHA